MRDLVLGDLIFPGLGGKKEINMDGHLLLQSAGLFWSLWASLRGGKQAWGAAGETALVLQDSPGQPIRRQLLCDKAAGVSSLSPRLVSGDLGPSLSLLQTGCSNWNRR